MKEKKYRNKLLLLGLFTLLSVVALFFIPPVPQNPGYHDFADKRFLLGIPNFWNVVSNVVFLAAGVYGLKMFYTSGKKNVSGFVVAAGAILISAGSAYYHFRPSNFTLVWDRIPMAVVFMGFLSFLVSSRVHEKTGKIILFPLILIGAGSVLYWYYTQTQMETGDLRFYGWVQFYPLLTTVLILFLFPQNDRVGKMLLLALLFYAFAKVCEHFDQEIFTALSVLSGHTLKHILAAVATGYITMAAFGDPE